jgi:hypothetical protein
LNARWIVHLGKIAIVMGLQVENMIDASLGCNRSIPWLAFVSHVL